MHDDIVYKVISLEDNGTVICQEFGEEDTITMDLEEATEAFNAYLNI